MLFADRMECPLSKEELLELVEEEARLRVSDDFLKEVGQLYLSTIFLNCSMRNDTTFLGGG